MEQFAGTVTKKLMDADLNLFKNTISRYSLQQVLGAAVDGFHLESGITILLIDCKVFFANERNLLIWCFGAQDVTQRYVLEALRLPDIVVVRL